MPKQILLGSTVDDESLFILGELFTEENGRKTEFKIPVRGEKAKLAHMAYENACERVRLESVAQIKINENLTRLASVLSCEMYPEKIEAYDISNIGAEHKICGMIVIENGKFKKKDYRTFNIKSVTGTDDYASMREAVERRLEHLADEEGSFCAAPDVILLDGGAAHVGVIKDLMRKKGLDIPVFGMVKDDHHKTRSLCTEDAEISIARDRELFRFIYGIQEEVHRYSVKRMTDAKRKTLKTSTLTNIKGIGDVKAKRLFECFGTFDEIKNANIDDFISKGFCERDARAIVEYFSDET